MTESELRRLDSQDPVLLEFWDAAGLDRAALGDLDRRIRLHGRWEESLRPGRGLHPFEDVLVDVVHDEESIRRQITRVDGLSGNDEVVVSVVEDHLGTVVIEITQASSWWDGPGTPLPVRRRLGSIEVPSDDADASAKVVEEIVKARRARRATFRICRFCRESVAPEHRIEDEVCHGCATEHLGVVY